MMGNEIDATYTYVGYYVLNTSELIEGLEYESFIKERNSWSLETFYFNKSHLENVMNNKCRVKHLDREDVESLGWEFKLHGFSEDGETTFDKFQKGDKFILVEDDGYILVWMENLSSVVYFRGMIKNKSELKKILKQVDV